MISKIKKLGLIGIACASILGNACYERAKRDYTPHNSVQNRLVSLDNIERIADKACDESITNEQGFFCRYRECLKQKTVPNGPNTSTYHYECAESEERVVAFDWKDYRSSTVVRGKDLAKREVNTPTVEICTKNGCDRIDFANRTQAEDFVDSLQVYNNNR